MTATAGMVKVMVVKGGAAGLPPGHMTCDEICAEFDPPIEFGPHSKMQGTMEGYQAEHIIPTAAFHQSGRSGPPFNSQCEGYSTGSALTWMVEDEQTFPSEHKLLTDPMREFSQQNALTETNAPLSAWLDKYEEGTQNALKDAVPKRKIKNPELDPDSLIAAAAKCIREKAEQAFASMRPPVNPDTPLRNPWNATKAQREAALDPNFTDDIE
jgi:hypothetical protein